MDARVVGLPFTPCDGVLNHTLKGDFDLLPAHEAGGVSEVTVSPDATCNQNEETHQVFDFGGFGDAVCDPVDTGDRRDKDRR